MNDSPRRFGNPDQALIQRFFEQGALPLRLDSNPMVTALGATLWSLDQESGAATIDFEPQALFIQGNGVLQGGALSAMLDFAMAYATLARQPRENTCATVNMSTAFLRPAPRGRYRAIGTIDRYGKTMAFTQARLMAADSGQLVATASSSLALIG